MDATTLREAVLDHLPRERVKAHAELAGADQRAGKLGVSALVAARVVPGGGDAGGRRADVSESYRDGGAPEVVRGGFYAWFPGRLAGLRRRLLDDAMEAAWERPPLLTGELAALGVKDWLAVDSETVTLPDELAEVFPATSTAAGLKVHKVYSLGRNNIVGIEITPARDHDAHCCGCRSGGAAWGSSWTWATSATS